MGEYTLKAKLIADASNLEKNFQKAQASLKGVADQFSKIGDKLTGIGAKASVGLTAPIALAGKSMVKAASDFEENLNKVDVAFGKSADSVKAWADNATKQFGLSKNQALEATSLFGDMATSMGLTQPAAADMSTSLAGLAGDLASFKNISIDQAMTALSSVFTGETESLKELGIVMTETNLDAFALANGFGKTTNQMTQAEKVQLRYAYVMEMSKNAQGDYARTADGTANSMRTFQGAVENLNVALGEHLLPILTPLIQKATEMVESFANASPEAQQTALKIAGITAVAGPAAVGLGSVANGVGQISNALSSFSGFLGSTTGKIKQFSIDIIAVKNSFNGMAGPLTAEQQKIADFVQSAGKHFQTLKTSASGMRTSVINSFSGISASLSNAGKTMGAGLSGLKTSLMTLGSSAAAAIAPFVPAILIFGAVAAAMVYLFNTNEEFRNSMLQSWAEIKAAFAPVLEAFQTMLVQVAQALMPAITQLGTAFATLMQSLTPLITLLAGIFAQVLTLVAQLFAQIVTAVAPLITMLISQLVPVITQIVQALAPLITQIVSALMPIIQAIVDILSNYVIPIVTSIITVVAQVVAQVIAKVIEIITPIVSFIAEVIAKVIEVVATIIQKVADIFGKVYETVSNVWNNIGNFIGNVIGNVNRVIDTIKGVVSSVFDAIWSTVSSVMGRVGNFISGVFDGIKNAWDGLTGFVSGVFEGIGNAVETLVGTVKGFVNNVIGGINAAIGLINMIPGVSIGEIPYLARGTDDFAGGFARINEGGRGELVMLPNGTQVIPHDVSMAYAKEAAARQSQDISLLSMPSLKNKSATAEWDVSQLNTNDQWTAIKNTLVDTLDTMVVDVQKRTETINTGIEQQWSAVLTTTQNYWSAIEAYLKATWQRIVTESESNWIHMRDGIRTVLDGLYSIVISGFAPSLNYISSLGTTLYGYGTNMIHELERGIRDTTSGVTGAIEELVETLKNKFIEGFEIHSPSHFTYYVGTMLGKGLMNSLKDSHLAAFVETMIAEMKDSFGKGKLDLQAVISFMGNKAGDLLKALGISLGGSTGIIGSNGMLWPSDSSAITSWFGARPYPGAGGSTNHGGLDIGASMGSNVYAALGGMVTSSGWLGGYGNAIEIDHGNGLSTLYGHMSQLLAGAGQTVAPGQVIGLVGSTGNSTGPHLHFETRLNGSPIDPMTFFPGFAIGSHSVPSDMLAMVHKGEAIIPEREVKELKKMTGASNPYKNSGGSVLERLGFNRLNQRDSSFGGLSMAVVNMTEKSAFGGSSTAPRWYDDIPNSKPNKAETLNIEVFSVMDGRKVGYGSARYVKEKNAYDEKRINRIRGIL